MKLLSILFSWPTQQFQIPLECLTCIFGNAIACSHFRFHFEFWALLFKALLQQSKHDRHNNWIMIVLQLTMRILISQFLSLISFSYSYPPFWLSQLSLKRQKKLKTKPMRPKKRSSANVACSAWAMVIPD